jgi:hypothetical protein
MPYLKLARKEKRAPPIGLESINDPSEHPDIKAESRKPKAESRKPEPLGGLLIVMGHHARSEALFYYFRLEDQVPESHLLRLIDKLVSFEFVPITGNY